MTGNITWEVLLGMFGILSAVFGIWWRLESKMKSAAEAASTLAKNAADAASLVALAAQAKAEIIATDLSKYQLHVAETYASKDGVTRQFELVGKSIAELGERIETRLIGTNERLDRLYEAGKPQSRSAN
jgi:hypothetical protein